MVFFQWEFQLPLFSVRPNKLFVLYTGRAVEQPVRQTVRYNQIRDLRLQAFVQSYKLCIHFWVIYSPQKGNEHEKVKKKLDRPSLTSKKIMF